MDIKTVTFDAETHQLVPKQPTAEILAGASIAVWPTASAADIALARDAALIAMKSMDAAPGVTLDMLAATIATMAPAYRAMLAAAPTPAAQSAGQEAGTWRDAIETAVQVLSQIEAGDDVFVGQASEAIAGLTAILHGQTIPPTFEQARDALCDALDAYPPKRDVAPVNGGEYAECCDTPNYCSSVRRCTAKDGKRAADAQHSDDKAVDLFAQAMKAKMADARTKGRGGWETCDPAHLSLMLREHVEKGDPRDVANFCAFLWNLGKPIDDAVLPWGKRSADAQQAGGSFEFHHVGHMHTVYGNDAAIKALLQYRKHLENVAANALKRAALTSPAKVGGDEREIFESRLGRGKTYTEREFTMWVDGLRIGRAALSADGGDTELLDWLAQRSAYVAHSRDGESCWVMIEDPDEDSGRQFTSATGRAYDNTRDAIRAAIAANQAKGDAS